MKPTTVSEESLKKISSNHYSINDGNFSLKTDYYQVRRFV